MDLSSFWFTNLLFSLSSMQLNLSIEISIIDFFMTDFSNLKFPLIL